jgi:hypothetical protein
MIASHRFLQQNLPIHISAEMAPGIAQPELVGDVDVRVVGGVRTIIIERISQHGGTMTAGGFAFPGLFNDAIPDALDPVDPHTQLGGGRDGSSPVCCRRFRCGLWFLRAAAI